MNGVEGTGLAPSQLEAEKGIEVMTSPKPSATQPKYWRRILRRDHEVSRLFRGHARIVRE